MGWQVGAGRRLQHRLPTRHHCASPQTAAPAGQRGQVQRSGAMRSGVTWQLPRVRRNHTLSLFLSPADTRAYYNRAFLPAFSQYDAQHLFG